MAKTRSYSVKDISKWQFKDQSFPKLWADHIGVIDDRLLMYIDGNGGNGKTEYVMQFAKMLACQIGKTRMNNVEQGKHSQIQKSAARNDFDSIPAGKFQYDNIRDFNAFRDKLARPNSGKIIIVDSISYWPLNAEQVQELIKQFKHKSFVFVAYQAHSTRNQPIKHLCDVKVRVENYIAIVEGSRFGGGKDYDIWPEKHKKQPVPQLSVFESNGHAK